MPCESFARLTFRSLYNVRPTLYPRIANGRVGGKRAGMYVCADLNPT